MVIRNWSDSLSLSLDQSHMRVTCRCYCWVCLFQPLLMCFRFLLPSNLHLPCSCQSNCSPFRLRLPLSIVFCRRGADNEAADVTFFFLNWLTQTDSDIFFSSVQFSSSPSLELLLVFFLSLVLLLFAFSSFSVYMLSSSSSSQCYVHKQSLTLLFHFFFFFFIFFCFLLLCRFLLPLSHRCVCCWLHLWSMRARSPALFTFFFLFFLLALFCRVSSLFLLLFPFLFLFGHFLSCFLPSFAILLIFSSFPSYLILAVPIRSSVYFFSLFSLSSSSFTPTLCFFSLSDSASLPFVSSLLFVSLVLSFPLSFLLHFLLPSPFVQLLRECFLLITSFIFLSLNAPLGPSCLPLFFSSLALLFPSFLFVSWFYLFLSLCSSVSQLLVHWSFFSSFCFCLSIMLCFFVCHFSLFSLFLSISHFFLDFVLPFGFRPYVLSVFTSFFEILSFRRLPILCFSWFLLPCRSQNEISNQNSTDEYKRRKRKWRRGRRRMKPWWLRKWKWRSTTWSLLSLLSSPADLHS